jgi:hypothetical protein
VEEVVGAGRGFGTAPPSWRLASSVVVIRRYGRDEKGEEKTLYESGLCRESEDEHCVGRGVPNAGCRSEKMLWESDERRRRI